MHLVYFPLDGRASYTFSLGNDFIRLTDGNKDLSAVYLASLTKAAIDNNGQPTDPESLTTRGHEIFLDYCADTANGVKPNKAIKKALKKRNK